MPVESLLKTLSWTGPALAPKRPGVGGGPKDQRPSVERHAAASRVPAGPDAPGPATPASAFAFAITRAMGAVVVTAHGDLDGSSAAVLKAVLVDLIEGQGNLRVIVDVHDMAVGDPSNLGVLAAAAASAARQDGELTFADPCAALLVAMEAIGLAGAVTETSHRRLRSLATPSPVPAAAGPRRIAMAQHPAEADDNPNHARSTTLTTTGAHQ